MRQKIPFAVYAVTIILIIYVTMILMNVPLRITSVIFMISPLLVIWMVLSVLKSKTFSGKDLEEGEEWGYSDRPKDKLGTF